ncbi:hypothetical protein B7494_g2063 [Chlorociboria aeruginascens]|nr:hypothetical protein B7494_g2063 [Chlorociboria aeruginascens]
MTTGAMSLILPSYLSISSIPKMARSRSILPFDAQERKRQMTYPLANSSRKKDRRWPLVLRFWKGSIHGKILFPVLLHALITAFVVYVNQHINSDFNLPSSIIPSLSIVVGLMLVFRNQTAFSRFWGGRCHLNTVTTSIRCISRQILVLVPAPALPGIDFLGSREGLNMFSRRHGNTGTRTPRSVAERSVADSGSEDSGEKPLSKEFEDKTIETIKILIAMLYTIKAHLRAEWGVALSPGTSLTADGQEATTHEYKDLLPPGLRGYEHRGLGLTLQLATFVEHFINVGVRNEWFHNAAASQMLGELNKLTSAYGSMEVIRLVPIPVAHLIHHKQTLALFCCILPFAMASEMDWWAVPLVAFVAFTLYGIEGIAQTYEDPFGVAKIDINMDDVVEDTRQEVEVLLAAWQTQGCHYDSLFHPQIPRTPHSAETSHYYPAADAELPTHVKFVVSDMSAEDVEGGKIRDFRGSTTISPGSGEGRDLFAGPDGDTITVQALIPGQGGWKKDSLVSPFTVLNNEGATGTGQSKGGNTITIQGGNRKGGKGKVTWGDGESVVGGTIVWAGGAQCLWDPNALATVPVVESKEGDEFKGLDWQKYAYVTYVTREDLLCNAVMILESLERLGSRAQRVMLIPDMGEFSTGDTGEKDTVVKGLLDLAENKYRAKLERVKILSKEMTYAKWKESYTKLLALNLTQYDRLIVLDSDATLLQPIDELFLLPPAPAALPRAYWLETPTLASHLMLLRPSTHSFSQAQNLIQRAGLGTYDMEIVNKLFGPSCVVLPHKNYALLTGEFRRPDDSHGEYLNRGEKWDPQEVKDNAKLVHFSDHPMPKPWEEISEWEVEQNQPAPGVRDGVEDFGNRNMWNALYRDFRERRWNVCGLGIP